MAENFSYQNLRGRNFKGQNLTGANFSGADIRGANFKEAILVGANFSHAKAGLQRRWVVVLIIGSMILSLVSGWTLGLSGFLIASLFTPEIIIDMTRIPGITALILIVFFIGLFLRQGVGAGAVAVAVAVVGGGAVAVAVAVVVGGAGGGAGGGAVGGAVAVAVAVAVAGAVTVAGAVAVAVAGAVAVAVAVAEAGAMIVAGAGAVAEAEAGAVVAVAGVVAGAVAGAAIWMAVCALGGDEKHALIRKMALGLAALGGTNFCGADLTDADFTGAALKCTVLIGATLTRTRFYEAKHLLRARVGRSILDPIPIRTLLRTGHGENKSYQGGNLQGANLTGASLHGANFKGANLSDATFQAANLENANLTLTEVIGTNFTHARMTGACIEAWNIDSTTQLDQVDCRYIYLLEDDRERRPSSGEFAPGEFTKLFQEVLSTVDLIFRNGVDRSAFIAAFQTVQVENEGTELTIQSIENKGDGVVVVRVNVPPEANKEKIHREFTQNYEMALKAIEEKYQAQLEGKDAQLILYRQVLEDARQREVWQNINMEKMIDILAKTTANVPINEQEVKVIADRQASSNLVILTLGSGDLTAGFASVIAQVWTKNDRFPRQLPGELLPKPELLETYQQWQIAYRHFIDPPREATNVSRQEVDALAESLEEHLNKWLNGENFLFIDRYLREQFNRGDEIRVIVQSNDLEIRKLPWHGWDFLKAYRKAEVALSAPFADRSFRGSPSRRRMRILAVLGNDRRINVDQDRQFLQEIHPETVFLVKPSPQDLHEQLWSEAGWDMFFFSGHSDSEMGGKSGYFAINDTDKLAISDVRNALQAAIERGLQIVMFNSCDGLGLAHEFASLHIPQMIVMRELIPDRAAQEFLKGFLTAFKGGKSFYVSIREAREKLEGLERYFPGVSFLPVICQNAAEIPPTWQGLTEMESE